MITYCEHFGINVVMTYFDARAKEYGIKTDIKLLNRIFRLKEFTITDRLLHT